MDHDVAGAGADDLHQGSGGDAGADRAHVGVEGSHGDGGRGGKPQPARPILRQRAGPPTRRRRLGVEACAQRSEAGSEGVEEFPVGQPSPRRVKHRLVPGGAHAATDRSRFQVARQHRRDPVADLDPARRGVEHLPGDVAAAEDLAPPPLRRVDPADLGQKMGPCLGGQARDLRRFRIGSVVLPEPYHGVRVPAEPLVETERLPRAVHRHRAAAGGIDADADHGLRAEIWVGRAPLAEDPDDGLFDPQDVIGRILASQVRLGRVQPDAVRSRRVGEDPGGQLPAGPHVDQQGPAGVGAEIEPDRVASHGRSPLSPRNRGRRPGSGPGPAPKKPRQRRSSSRATPACAPPSASRRSVR